MRIYRREKSGSWWMDASVSSQRINRSLNTKDKALATQYANRIIADAFEGIKLGKRPDYTLAHAAEDWLLKHRKDRKSIETIKQRISWLILKIGAMPLSNISRPVLDELLSKMESSPATKNRYVAEVSKLMHHSKTLGWIDHVPAYRRYSEPKGRVRWLTREEANKLAVELPGWLQELFWFALATGLRESNIRLLRWDHVSLERNILWVDSENAKGNKTFGIPLNHDAHNIIKNRVGNCDLFVFGNRGVVPCRCSGPAWYAALKKLGMEGFRWHDLRHSWASWHAQQGTPGSVLQQLGGWSTPSMVTKYAHLSESYLAQWANNSRKDNDSTV